MRFDIVRLDPGAGRNYDGHGGGIGGQRERYLVVNSTLQKFPFHEVADVCDLGTNGKLKTPRF